MYIRLGQRYVFVLELYEGALYTNRGDKPIEDFSQILYQHGKGNSKVNIFLLSILEDSLSYHVCIANFLGP